MPTALWIWDGETLLLHSLLLQKASIIQAQAGTARAPAQSSPPGAPLSTCGRPRLPRRAAMAHELNVTLRSSGTPTATRSF